MASILIKDVGKRLGNQTVLAGLNLEVNDKEFITLLGPSGCGKTTTLRILAGFLTPDSGEVYVDGQCVSSARGVVPPEKRRMGMVFQNYAVWPHMTVFENVAFGLKLAKVSRAETERRVAEALRLVGLEGLGARYPAMLSGGQQQRVALARSLVVEPAILLLDEPLSNLDAKLRDRMRVELKELQRRTGITFVYVTHDQAEAMALSDRVAVMNGGVLQQYGTPREMYERPANLFVADFMGSVNKVPGSVTARTDGAARVAIGAGQSLAAIFRDGAAGTAGDVTVIIRPEAIRLSGAAPTAIATATENLLRGVVAEATFLGNLVDYRVDVAGILLHVQSDRQTFYDVGTAVCLTIPSHECVAMTTSDYSPSPLS
ncbi:MAG: ABC transporter ATP-binding protein [Chloroflexota bacterium]|nr:ABC transporter ATP-binding protein [Chloroflexota bacterium]